MTDIVVGRCRACRAYHARTTENRQGPLIAGSIAPHGLLKFVSPSKHVVSDNLFSLAITFSFATCPYLSYFIRMILFHRRDINNPKDAAICERLGRRCGAENRFVSHIFFRILRARRLSNGRFDIVSRSSLSLIKT